MTPTIDLRDLIGQINRLADHLPHDVVALAARIFPAVVFWQSARTKVDGLTIKDSTYFLFEQVYALHLIPPQSPPSLRQWPNICCRSCWCLACLRGLARWGCWA